MLHFVKQKCSVNTFGKSVELLPAYIQFLLKLPKLLTRGVKVDSGSEQDHYAVFPLRFLLRKSGRNLRRTDIPFRGMAIVLIAY